MQKVYTYSFLKETDINKGQFLLGKNNFYFGIGNTLKIGIIDPDSSFHNNELISITALINKYPNLILDNIDLNNKEYSFTLANPDFDICAAVYLAQQLIENQKLPDNSNILADYVERVEKGTVILNPDNPPPFAIVRYLKTKVREKTKYKFQEVFLEKALELIDYFMGRLNEIYPQSFDNPAFFPPDNELYRATIEKIRAGDKEKYYNQKRNDCKVKQLCLPLNDKKGAFKKVDAIFFQKEPKGLFYKVWARQDVDSPSGSGFTFTSFVKEDRPGATLSVDRHSNVTLRGLAEVLNAFELEELKKLVKNLKPASETEDFFNLEKKEIFLKIFKDYNIPVDKEELKQLEALKANFKQFDCNKNYKINISQKKEEVLPILKDGGFKEQLKQDIKLILNSKYELFTTIIKEWDKKDSDKTKSYKWYDGAKHAYTMVAPPLEGSLLTLDTIEKAVNVFTQPKVKDAQTRLIYPFKFNSEKLEIIKKNLNEKALINTNNLNDLLPYIQEYLSEPNCFKYKLDNTIIENLLNYQDILDIKNAEIVLFKYGNGFLYLDFKPQKNMWIENFLALNKTHRNKNLLFQKVKAKISQLCSMENVQVENPLVYTAITLCSDSFQKSEKKEIVYKLCNVCEYQDEFTKGLHNNSLIERLFFEFEDDNIFYGFSKKGGALVVIDRKNNMVNRTVDKFFETDFYIFLLNLHHRLLLLDLSHCLAKDMSQAGKLRQTMLEFTINSWFSQISNEELRMDIFRRWKRILETAELYNEVFEQLNSLDDFNKSRLSHIFEKISIIFFPIVLAASIFGMNIREFSGDESILTIYNSVGSTLIGLALWFVFWELFKNRK